MPLKLLCTVFITVFLAELGDKTQLAVLLFAAGKGGNWLTVFLGASLALVLASLLAVVLGSQFYHWISPRLLKILAGVGFILIGLMILWDIRM